MPEKLTVGAALRELRRTLKLTQVSFAKKTGVSVSSIAHFELDARRPDAETCVRFIRAAIRMAKPSREDLADVFAADLPGVREELLAPTWRKPGDRRRPAHYIEIETAGALTPQKLGELSVKKLQ